MVTERLKIRKFTNNDLTELYNLLSDEDVMEFIEPPFSLEKTADFLNSVALIDPPLIYTVEDFNQNFIGYVIFHEYDEDSFELGWILNKRYWGKGYANDLTKVFIERSSEIGKNLVIECYSNQEISKHIALKNDFEFLGESYECSVFKRKLVC
jgi:acetyltransferase, GNAT family